MRYNAHKTDGSVFITANGMVVLGHGFKAPERRGLIEQFQLAQQDPDYSIVCNFLIVWEDPKMAVRYVHVPGGSPEQVDAARDKLERRLAKRVGLKPRGRSSINRSQAALRRSLKRRINMSYDLGRSVFISQKGTVVFPSHFGKAMIQDLLGELRKAQQDPDHTVVTNYEVVWEQPKGKPSWIVEDPCVMRLIYGSPDDVAAERRSRNGRTVKKSKKKAVTRKR